MSDYINDSIRVWVCCLASYNNGALYGRWIDLEKDAPTLKDFYKIVYDDILKNSPADDAEEWKILRIENLNDSTCTDIEKMYKSLEIKKNCDDVNVFNAAMNLVDKGIAQIDDLQSWIDGFVGFYDSKIDYAVQIFNACEQCPDHLRPYIDIQRYARHLYYHFEFCEKTGAVFASNKPGGLYSPRENWRNICL
jgi:antirestriction protein